MKYVGLLTSKIINIFLVTEYCHLRMYILLDRY
jgi:hypothetical protein